MLMKLAFAACLLRASVYAQDRAAINGSVKDPSGAVVPDARVELKSAATGFHRVVQTNSQGLFEIAPLGVGTYTIAVSKTGFKSVTVEGIDLQYGETRTIDTRLEVGTLADTVQVEATVEALNRTNAEVGGVIDSSQIKEIPVSGRNWASLTLLAPGAINYGDGAQRSIRFNGHSLDDSNFTFDGVDTSGIQEQTQKADTRLNIALDSIAEFRVSTSNYTAESGSAGGAQVNVVSKSGSNAFHGSAFYALRNDALDARSPFNGPDLPPFTLHQFGGSAGGAVIKNKAFFFLNYEGLRQDLGQSFNNVVPNAAFRAQVLAKSPALKPIIDAYPIGQKHLDGISDEVDLVSSNTVREDAGMARFDYRFNDANSVFVRYNIDNAYIVMPQDALGTSNVIPHIPTNEVLQYQRILSPRTVNEAKFGVNRANYHNYTFGTSPVAVNLSDFDSVSD